jgi:glycosyltransferase involved in cell wall biosynthesis
MVVWLVTIGEPLPIDGKNVRLHRTGMLADLLFERGHTVVWWTSTFDHFKKVQRYKKDTTVDVGSGYKIELLYSMSYRSTVSIARTINHYRVAKKFSKLIRNEQKPDLILCSFPTVLLSYHAAMYGAAAEVPVVLDARDMWPDIFLNLVPKWSRRFVHLLLMPSFRKAKKAFEQAYSITGMTPDFIKWGLRYAGREKTGLDRDFPFGYRSRVPDKAALKGADSFWKSYGIDSRQNPFIVCFFGTIGRQFEIETVIQAARELQAKKIPVSFILCGDGDRLELYKDQTDGLANVMFPGWVGEAEIWSLMRKAAVGLAPYIDTVDFQSSIPNKIIEYLSAGLPVVSSLRGQVSDLLEEYNCGSTYDGKIAGDLVDTIVRLYEDTGARDRMSKNAARLFEKRFTAEKVYSEMIDYLVAVYNSKSRTGEKS